MFKVLKRIRWREAVDIMILPIVMWLLGFATGIYFAWEFVWHQSR